MPYKDPEVRKAKALERYRKNKKEDPERLNLQAYAWRAANPEKWRLIQERAVERSKNNGKYTEKVERKSNYLLANPEARARVIARTHLWKMDNYERYILQRLRRRAEEKGLAFDLTPEDIVIPLVCPVLGTPLVKDGYGQREDRPSVDRIDPRLGYVRGNIQVISMKANAIKNSATVEEVAKVLAYMRRFSPQK